jgi:hypothetical protein
MHTKKIFCSFLQLWYITENHTNIPSEIEAAYEKLSKISPNKQIKSIILPRCKKTSKYSSGNKKTPLFLQI